MLLNTYWDHFNYTLLKVIVDLHGSEDLRQRMKIYVSDLFTFWHQTKVEDFINFCKKNNYKLKKWPTTQAPLNFAELKCVISRPVSECTLYEVECIRCQFSHGFHLQDFALVLFEIGESSLMIMISWKMDVGLKRVLKDLLVTKESKFLEKLYVKCIFVDGSCIYNMESKYLIGQGDLKTATITYSTVLGRGAFAVLYKAKCDKMLCAAKILHTISCDDPVEKIRFYQESKYLKYIRHPNIVQYFGWCQEPATGQPVLLMELMDSNLTNFLESSPGPLNRTVQFQLCHDVAKALAYLHSINIIHRSLDSNNVLLGHGRAKVSDFGMSRVINTFMDPYTLTMAADTVAYLPQEALGENPRYSFKLDCFSFGVLVIQMITQLFPNPLPRMKEIRSALSPSGSILVPVAETECRRDHIDMIDKSHPLLDIAIQCLELRSEERPSAQDVCDRIEYFRSTPDDETQTGDQGLCLDPVKDAGPSCHMEIASKLKSAPERVQGEHSTSTTPLRVQGELSTCTTAEQVQRTRPSQLPAMLPLPCSGLTINWKSGDPAPSVVARSSTTVFCGSMLSCIDHLMYDYNVESGKWGAPLKLSAEDRQSSSLLVVSSNQLGKLFAVKNTIIYNVHDGEWIAQGHLKFIPWGALSHEKYVLFFGSQGQVVTIDFSNGSGCEHSSLHTSPSFSCASVKICNGAVYLIGAQSKQVWLKQVYTCPIHELIQKSSWRGLRGKRVSWRELTPLPVSRSTSVVFKDHLLAVGGIANGQAVGDIFLHDEEEHNWEVVSHIPSPRYNCLAEVVGNQLVVVGGWMNHVEKCDLVEIATF